MQTLAQTLTAGNTAGGTPIKMGTAPLDLNDGSGSGGGTLNVDNGSIANCNQITANYVYADGPLTLRGTGSQPWVLDAGNLQTQSNACQLSLNGSKIVMGNGTGTGGGVLEMDAATLDTGTLDETSPTNPATPTAWWRIEVNGEDYWLPLYQ